MPRLNNPCDWQEAVVHQVSTQAQQALALAGEDLQSKSDKLASAILALDANSIYVAIEASFCAVVLRF